MGVNKYIPLRQINSHHKLLVEKQLLEKHFAFLTVNLSGSQLVCKGYCQPSKTSITYQYKIKYEIGDVPRVFTVNPVINYEDDIHMYSSDNRLCLYYPRDYSWTENSHLFNTIMPWTHEWFVFYELYQITGKWHHPFVDHNKI